MSKLQELQRSLSSFTQQSTTLRAEQQHNITEASDLLRVYNSEINSLKSKYDADVRKNFDQKRKIESDLSSLDEKIKDIEREVTKEQDQEREEAEQKLAREAKERADAAKK